MAPTYATLTLAYLEENLYEITGKKYSNGIKEEFTKSWKRYLGDCFIFWKCPIGRHQPTTKPTPQNKIYYRTQLKRITILRHLYKKT